MSRMVTVSIEEVNEGQSVPKFRLNDGAKLPSFARHARALLDLSDQYRSLAGPIRAAIDEVLASQELHSRAQRSKHLKRRSPNIARPPNAIGVSSGTDALLAILMALGDRARRRRYHERPTHSSPPAVASRGWARRRSSSISIPATYNISTAALDEYLTETVSRAKMRSCVIRMVKSRARHRSRPSLRPLLRDGCRFMQLAGTFQLR